MERQDSEDAWRTSVMSKKSKLTAKPTIHQLLEEKDGKLVNTASRDRKVSWLELLFDLAIVSAAEQLVKAFRADVSEQQWTAPLIFVLKLTSILSVWGSVDNYVNRYGRSESLFDCMFILFQSIAIFGTIATVDVYTASSTDDSEQRRCLSGFAIGIAFSHFFQLIAQIRVALLLPDSRAFSASLLIQIVLWTILWLIVAFTPAGELYVTYTLFTIAATGDFFREYLWLGIKNLIPFEKYGIKYTYIPMNIMLGIERAGLLVIIAIGEVTSAVTASSLSAGDFGNIILAICLGFLYKFMYFDVFDCLGEEAETVALTLSRPRAMGYLKLHIAVVVAIILSSYHLIPEDGGEDEAGTDDFDDGRFKIYNQLVFAVCVDVTMLSMFIMGHLHKKSDLHRKSQRVPVLFRGIFMVAAALFLLLLAGLVSFPDNALHIGITEIVLGVCMLVEYSCEWYFLDIAKIDKMFLEIMEETQSVALLPLSILSDTHAADARSDGNIPERGVDVIGDTPSSCESEPRRDLQLLDKNFEIENSVHNKMHSVDETSAATGYETTNIRHVRTAGGREWAGGGVGRGSVLSPIDLSSRAAALKQRQRRASAAAFRSRVLGEHSDAVFLKEHLEEMSTIAEITAPVYIDHNDGGNVHSHVVDVEEGGGGLLRAGDASKLPLPKVAGVSPKEQSGTEETKSGSILSMGIVHALASSPYGPEHGHVEHKHSGKYV